MPAPLMCFVTRQQPMGGGQCSKRDWTARLISAAAGTTTNEALEIWTANFGLDWTRFTGWQKYEAAFEWTLKKSTGRQHMPSTTFLALQVREENTNWVLEHSLVCYLQLPHLNIVVVLYELESWSGNSDFVSLSHTHDRNHCLISVFLCYLVGTAGDSLSYHRGSPFSTKDRDNDNYSGDCVALYGKGGWWFDNCVTSNLNGLYLHGTHSTAWEGVDWGEWKGDKYSAKRAEMKIKPINEVWTLCYGMVLEVYWMSSR